MPASPRWQRGPSPAAGLSRDLPSPADSPELRIKPRSGGREGGRAASRPHPQHPGRDRARAPSPRRTLRLRDTDLNTLLRHGARRQVQHQDPSQQGFQPERRPQPLPQGSTRQQRAACSGLPGPRRPRQAPRGLSPGPFPARHTRVPALSNLPRPCAEFVSSDFLSSYLWSFTKSSTGSCSRDP